MVEEEEEGRHPTVRSSVALRTKRVDCVKRKECSAGLLLKYVVCCAADSESSVGRQRLETVPLVNYKYSTQTYFFG